MTKKSDEVGRPPTPIAKPGQPTPAGVKIERREGRVASYNESVGGEVSSEKYRK
jgi:hypothetical protein